MTPQEVRVNTGSRLHFGLLDTSAPFGGLGMMIEEPSTEIVIRKSDSPIVINSEAVRLLKILQRYRAQLRLTSLPACQIDILRRPAAHTGLGSGTQLSLSFAEALAVLFENDFTEEMIAIRIADRGKRSAIGIHGYFHGGLIFEEGDGQSELNPITHRVNFPETWCVAIIRPRNVTTTVSGDFEMEQFSKLPQVCDTTRVRLRSIATDRLVPAVVGSDFSLFSDAVFEYNWESGMLFKEIQDGPYNGEGVKTLIKLFRDQGVKGVGQSSWGPSVFAWFEDRPIAESFFDKMPHVENYVVQLTKAKNEPRELRTMSW